MLTTCPWIFYLHINLWYSQISPLHFGKGRKSGGSFYNKKLAFSLAASTGRFSASLKFPVAAVHPSLWTNISNRFQMISVMPSALFKFLKMCPTYQTSSVSHMLCIARSIQLHGIMWNKYPWVTAPRAISALFLCVALGGLVQASLIYQWTPLGALHGREKNPSSWL